MPHACHPGLRALPDAPLTPSTSCAADLPGFTRSVYERNYALVTPESLVFAGNPRWANASTAHIISPAVGANFAMALVSMRKHSHGTAPPSGHERWVWSLSAAGLGRGMLRIGMTGGGSFCVLAWPHGQKLWMGCSHEACSA